jgi:hypothetical protein
MNLARRLIAVVAVLFGAATLWSGGNVLFGAGAGAAGNYVPFVVWFNFLAGFAYVAAGIGIWRRRSWGTALAIALALLTAIAFVAFGGYVATGGAYETRTVVAMTLRTALWVVIAVLLTRTPSKRGQDPF